MTTFTDTELDTIHGQLMMVRDRYGLDSAPIKKSAFQPTPPMPGAGGTPPPPGGDPSQGGAAPPPGAGAPPDPSQGGGAPPPPPGGDPQQQAIAQMLQAVEQVTMQLQQMDQRIAGVEQIAQPMAELSAKVDLLEKAINAPAGFDQGQPTDPAAEAAGQAAAAPGMVDPSMIPPQQGMM